MAELRQVESRRVFPALVVRVDEKDTVTLGAVCCYEKALRLYVGPSALQNSLKTILKRKKWKTTMRAASRIQKKIGSPPYE